jgi:hypothetical protein
LLMAAYFARLQGIDLLRENENALDRMAQTLIKGHLDQRTFAEKAGIDQEPESKNSTHWMVLYNDLRPGQTAIASYLKAHPAGWKRQLGGNVTSVLKSQVLTKQ